MGEQKRKKRAHEAILNACRDCIYCSKSGVATTIEHMPPRAMFWRKDRPKGLEFPCCERCNRATKHVDLVASLLGRMFPNPPSEGYGLEMQRLFGAVSKYVPGLLEEMHIGKAGQKLARKRTPIPLEGGFLRSGGPLVTAHMDAFAAKLGFALHYETVGKVLPLGGAVFARWFTNVQNEMNVFPGHLTEMLPQPKTLKQGKKEVSEQFKYSFARSDDSKVGFAVATFRYSFAVVTVWSADKSQLELRAQDATHVWAPGDLATRPPVSKT